MNDTKKIEAIKNYINNEYNELRTDDREMILAIINKEDEAEEEQGNFEEELTIKIYRNSEGEFNYDIFDTNNADEDMEPVDGGTCTGDTMQEALSMASDHAQRLLINNLIYGDKNN